MEERELFVALKKIFCEYEGKGKFLSSLKSEFFVRQANYRIDFNILVIGLQNEIEDAFDRILRCYIRPKNNDDEYLYDDEIMKLTKAKIKPEEVRKSIIFNLGFAEKKALIFRLFHITKTTREIINKLNEVRNAIAHRYEENDKRFIYNGRNILLDLNTMVYFFADCFVSGNEIFDIDTNLLDAIDKAEQELDN